MSDSPFANIIFEDPARDDAFHGKGHRRSAKALADSIKQVANEKDGAIGLEGTWGSGKSTVLLMTEDALKELDSEHAYKVFTFDLWTHHTDEFKRAFLEEFLTWCSSWLSDEQVAEQRGRIRNRTKEVDTTNRKTFSLTGTALLLLLPFLPIAISWISPAAFNQSQDIIFNGFTWPDIIIRVLGMLASIPLLIFLAKILIEWAVLPSVRWYQFQSWKRRRSGPGATERNAPPKRTRPELSTISSEVLSLFSRDSRKDTVTQNIRDEDPTTVEFYKVFRELLALVQVDKRRVVIVLDNIDRLPLTSVPAAWSEVRSVFATSDARVVSGNTRVIAVVPYDRTYIADAFSRPKAAPPVQFGTLVARMAAPAEAAENDDEEEAGEQRDLYFEVLPPAQTKHTADDFRFADGDIFNKMFSRILKVSPPVGSHWGDFLEAAMQKAFGDQHTPATRNKLLRLLQLYLQRNLIHPTPRLIVGYVNEIGAYWTQRDRDIPVESIGLFVLLRSKIDASPDALTTPDLVNERYLNIVDQKERWLEHMAALAFNVSVDDAAEVLLGDKIRLALLDETFSSLPELSKLNGFEKFFQQYLSVILEELASEDAKLVGMAALNVAELNLSDAVHGHVWRSFAHAIPLLTKIGDASGDEFLGFASIVKGQSAADAVDVANHLRSIFTLSPSGTQFETGERWVRRVLPLAEALEEKLSRAEALEFWTSSLIPNDGFYAVGVAQELDPESHLSYAAVRNRPDLSLLAGTLEVTLADLPHQFVRAISSLAPTMTDEQKVAWLTKMAESLRSSDRGVEDAGYIIQASVLLDHQFPSNNSPTSPSLTSLIKDGTLVWYAHKGFQEQDYRLLGDALVLLFRRGVPPSITSAQHPAFGSFTPATDWLTNLLATGELPEEATDRVVDQVGATGALPAWLRMAATDKTGASLLVEIVGRVVRLRQYRAVSIASLILHYQSARAVLDEEEIDILLVGMGTAFGDDEVQHAIDEQVFGSISPELLADIATYASATSMKAVTARVDAVLKAMTKEEWETSLAEEDHKVALAIASLKTHKLILPPPTFMEALQAHVSAIFTSGRTVTTDSGEWNSLANALQPASRKTLAGRILAAMPQSGISSAAVDVFLKNYRTLADVMPLDSSPVIAINVFLREVVSAPSDDAMDYLRGKSKEFRDVLDKVDLDTFNSFMEIIDGMDEGDEQLKGKAAEIRSLLALKPRSHGR